MNARPFYALSMDTIPNLPVFEKQPVETRIVASRLDQPAGIALHPLHQMLYVAESNKNRLVVFRKLLSNAHDDQRRRFVGAIDCVETGLPWGPGEKQIRRPRQIEIDANGCIYVMEGCRGGRLLRFEPGSPLPANADVIAIAAEDYSRRFVWMGLDAKERPIVASAAVAQRHPGLWVRVYDTDGDGEWKVVEENASFLPPRNWRRCGPAFPQMPGPAAAAGESWVEDVAAFLHCLSPSGPVGGVAIDWEADAVYFSLREEGAVVRVRRA